MSPNKLDFSWRKAIVPAVIVACGVAVRSYALGAQSFWTDEIAAVITSARPFSEILVTIAVQDVNPPLFYLLLKIWLLLGQGEAIVRLFSVLASGGAILATYFLALRLFDRTTATIAAILLAASPLSVYLAQEVRYYSLLELLAPLTFLGYLRLRDGKSALWLMIPLLLGLFTHYYFLLIAGVIFAWAILDAERKNLPRWKFAGGFFGALLIWSPWIAAIRIQLERGSLRFRPDFVLNDALVDLGTFLTFGHADGVSPLDGGPVTASLLLLAMPFWILAIAGLAKSFRNVDAARISLWLFLPIIAVIAVSGFFNLYGHRYFMIVLPALAILAAVGARALIDIHFLLVVVALIPTLGLQGMSLASYFTDPRYARENWRGLAEHVETLERKGDALLVFNEGQAGPFNFYYNGNLSENRVLTSDFTTFAQQPKEEVEKRLTHYLKKHKRLIFISHFAHMYEPHSITQAFLEAKGVRDRTPGDTNLFGVPYSIWYTSRKSAFKALWKSYDTYIDFSTQNFHLSQLDGPLTHLEEPWIWMGKWGRFYLRNPENASKAKIKFLADPAYHGGTPISLYILADGKPILQTTIGEKGVHEIEAPLPQIHGELVEIGLLSQSTFDPVPIFGGTDHSVKSVLIGYVGVE
jgi:mannosyltransferase